MKSFFSGLVNMTRRGGVRTHAARAPRAFVAILALVGCSAVPEVVPPARESVHTREIVQPSVIELAPGLHLNRARNEVIIRAQVAARIGWMEQIVCKAGTREHESLLVVEVAPRLIHAALLMLGCEPGTPGSWQEVLSEPSATADATPTCVLNPPTGSPLDIRVRFMRGEERVDISVSEWLRSESATGESIAFASDRFVFAGSHTRPNPPSLGPGEHYVADYTGSVVGLVTFGDEVIAFADVIPDRIEISPALWEAYTERIPAEGTEVELILQPRARTAR